MCQGRIFEFQISSVPLFHGNLESKEICSAPGKKEEKPD